MPDVEIHFTRLLYANGYTASLDAANTQAKNEAPGAFSGQFRRSRRSLPDGKSANCGGCAGPMAPLDGENAKEPQPYGWPTVQSSRRNCTGTKPMAGADRKSESNGFWNTEMARKRSAGSYVICLNNQGYAASLEMRKVYRAIPDAAAKARGFIRVMDESGEDYLYPAVRFVPVRLPAAAERALVQAK